MVTNDPIARKCHWKAIYLYCMKKRLTRSGSKKAASNKGMFAHLSPTDFEELTYDLLKALGFVNLSWRKGSGKKGSSADQGRDIEADQHMTDIDGSEYFENYFVQCKHYTKGVPPEELQGGITWANSERPKVLLFVASNFLSNPAKNWIENYEKNSRPSFRIKLWERKNIENFLNSNPNLAKRYNIKIPNQVTGLHAAHLRYMRFPGFNTMNYFLSFLDTLEPSKRDELFSFSYSSVIKPRYRKARHKKETMGDLMLDQVDYPAFRTKCEELSGLIAENFLVKAIMSETLTWTAHFGDAAQVVENIANHRAYISHADELIKKTTDKERKADLQNVLKGFKKNLQAIPAKQKAWADNYKFLCETILPHLYLEELQLMEAQRSSSAI